MARAGVLVLVVAALLLGVPACSSSRTSRDADSSPAASEPQPTEASTDDGEDRALTAAEQVEFVIKPQVGEKMFVEGPAPDGEREAVLYERFNNFTTSGDPRWKVIDSQNEATFDRYEFSDGSAIIFRRESRDMVEYLKSYEVE